jgi:hypothetical protein
VRRHCDADGAGSDHRSKFRCMDRGGAYRRDSRPDTRLCSEKNRRAVLNDALMLLTAIEANAVVIIPGAVDLDSPFPSWPGDSPGHLPPHLVERCPLLACAYNRDGTSYLNGGWYQSQHKGHGHAATVSPHCAGAALRSDSDCRLTAKRKVVNIHAEIADTSFPR